MNTTTKQRFKTWDATIEALEKLEAAGPGDSTQLKAQVSALTVELAARNAEIKALKAAAAGQQSVPATNQPPAVKPIDQMTSAELTIACDQAAQAGDHTAANRFYLAYLERKANR
jgi:hypothetical protein